MDITFDNYMTYGAIMTFNEYKKFMNCDRYVKVIIKSRNDIAVKRGTDTKFRDAVIILKLLVIIWLRFVRLQMLVQLQII